MKRLFVNLLVVAAVVAVVAFFTAPPVAFLAIRSAADASDVQGLSRLVDFDAVRRSLRPQMGADPQALAPAPSFLDDPIGAVRRRLRDAAPPPPDQPSVDDYLTPQALAALTRGEGRMAGERPLGSVRGAAGDPFPRPLFWSVNRARFGVSDEGGSRTVFTLERRGPYEWMLVHIGLPQEVAAAPTRRPPSPPAP